MTVIPALPYNIYIEMENKVWWHWWYNTTIPPLNAKKMLFQLLGKVGHAPVQIKVS